MRTRLSTPTTCCGRCDPDLCASLIVLLPPSEAKRDGGHGPPLEPEDSALGMARTRVLGALAGFCDAGSAAAVELALPARSAAADLAANRVAARAPTMPALDRYTGIVYAGLSAATLTRAARRKASGSVLIFSGLFGVSRAEEPLPWYRLPVSATLPDVGALTAFWRRVLAVELPPMLGDGLVVDLRSSDYAAMWRPSGGLRERVLEVRVLSRRPGRDPVVISYESKLGKGQLTRALVSGRRLVRTPGDVVDAWIALGGHDASLGPGNRVDLIA